MRLFFFLQHAAAAAACDASVAATGILTSTTMFVDLEVMFWRTSSFRPAKAQGALAAFWLGCRDDAGFLDVASGATALLLSRSVSTDVKPKAK